MRIETEQQALEYAKAATFGECHDTDSFLRFWQDPWLRAEIHRECARLAGTREDYQDLWGEAWAAICELKPGVSRDDVWHVGDSGRPTKGIAFRALRNEYYAQLQYRKRFGGFVPTG